MSIDEPLKFGKYKDFTIEQIFGGSNTIDRTVFESFFSENISSPPFLSNIDIKDLELIDTLNFQITNHCFCVFPEKDEFKSDQSRAISRLFRVRDTVAERKAGFININKYIISKNSLNKEKIYTLSGHPQYIEWCINTIDTFFISPDDIKKLQEFTSYQYMGIEVRFKNINAYDYAPVYLSQKYIFEDVALENNLRKYNQFFSAKTRQTNTHNNNDERHTYKQF